MPAPWMLTDTSQLPTLAQASAVSGGVPRPPGLTLLGSETLQFTAYASNTPATLTIAWRVWRASDGQLVDLVETIDAGGPAVGVTKNYAVPVGVLFAVRASLGSGSVKFGNVWVDAKILLGSSGATVPIQTLMQGYVATASDIAWPGSPLQSPLDGPGAIVDGAWEFKVGPARTEALVPAGLRWRVIAGVLILRTSAIGGIRTMIIRATSALGLDYWRAAPTADVGASANITYAIAAGIQPSNTIANAITFLPWPPDLELSAGDAVAVEISGAQAGDFTDSKGLLVRQWIDL